MYVALEWTIYTQETLS